jgi:acetyltransferase-like isoleucine patch superfamily enzyme
MNNPILENYNNTGFEHGLGVIINKNPEHLDLAEGVALNGLIDTIHKVTIEKSVMFGHDTMILTGSHDYNELGEDRKKLGGGGPVTIREGAWIASRAIIIGPCEIGAHAVIGAGAVVSKDIPAYQVWAGNPVKFIKEIPH